MAKSIHAQAAAQIRAYLKERGIKAKVRASAFAGGDSVRIALLDDVAPDIKAEVEQFCGQYEMGHFDGMIDLYEYSNVRDDIPQVKYVFVEMEYSPEIRQRVWDWLRANWADMDDAPADYDGACNYYCRNVGLWGNNWVWRMLNEQDCFVWQEAA